MKSTTERAQELLKQHDQGILIHKDSYAATIRELIIALALRTEHKRDAD